MPALDESGRRGQGAMIVAGAQNGLLGAFPITVRSELRFAHSGGSGSRAVKAVSDGRDGLPVSSLCRVRGRAAAEVTVAR